MRFEPKLTQSSIQRRHWSLGKRMSAKKGARLKKGAGSPTPTCFKVARGCYSCTLASSTGRTGRLTTLNISPIRGLVVLDLQLKHDHPLLGLRDVLHPLVVGPALNVDELARVLLFGSDSHSYKGSMEVAPCSFALALVREVGDGKTPIFREVFKTTLQSLLVGSITAGAVDIDIVLGICALGSDMLLNLF